MKPETTWGELPLEPGETHVLELGTLRLHIRRREGEFWFRTERSGAGTQSDPEWTRWAVRDGASLRLAPAVPDRLTVVSYDPPFRLPPRGEARVFVRIPLHAQIWLRPPEGKEVLTCDVPTTVLSDTWWGTVERGELAYWIHTKARATVESAAAPPEYALCPFHLKNQSSTPLLLQRFAVRVPHLTLFGCGDRVWTDEVDVRYSASADGSEIEVRGAAPPECPSPERLASPRTPAPRGFRALTFLSSSLGG